MSIDMSCDWKSGFIMDPTKKQRCGYLVGFNGLGLTEEPTSVKDPYKIKVFCPYNAGSDTEYKDVQVTDLDGQKVLQCVGIIESFSFGGGVGDPICVSAYVSTEFANQLKAKQKASLSTTTINKLSWWVVNYDVEEKAWYEEAFPIGDTDKSTVGFVKGQLNASGGKDVRLAVAESPTIISPSIDIQVFNLYFEIVPASDNTYALTFRQAKSKPYVKGWGLQVGSIAKNKLSGAK